MGEPEAIHKRQKGFILVMLLVFSAVTYLDRVNISIAAKYIMPEFGFTSIQMGWVFSAFVLGYGLLQVPGGWLGDTFGPRKVLTFAVIWWSIFTALTGLADRAGFSSLLGVAGSFMLIRFLIGVGEGTALPTYNRVIADWMPATERAWASSFVLAGLGIGGAVAPPLTAFLMHSFGWRTAFYTCALAGIGVGVIWYRFSSEKPAQRLPAGSQPSSVSQSPAPRPGTPWAAILSDSNIWLITLSQFCCGYVVNVYVAWFYLYLIDVRGFGILGGSFYASGPFIASALLSPAGGLLCDRWVRSRGKRFGRTAVALGSMCLGGVMITLGAKAGNPYVAVTTLSFGAACVFAAIPAFWGALSDIAEQFSGTVTGISLVGTNLGGVVAPVLTPAIARRFGWIAALNFAAVLSVAGGAVWLLVHPERPILGAPVAAAAEVPMAQDLGR